MSFERNGIKRMRDIGFKRLKIPHVTGGEVKNSMVFAL